MPTKIEKDSHTGVETTGHEWDGIKELNNPLPKWWLYMFYLSVAIALVYFVFMPSIPLGTTYFGGVRDYSARQDAENAVAAGKEAQSAYLEQIAANDLADIAGDNRLLTFAMAGGAAAFATNCAPCHAQGGAGQQGVYPALVDDDWLWGGSYEAIHDTIAYGVRSEHPETRYNMMPAFGEWMTEAEMRQATAYVLALADLEHDTALAEPGATVFAENCTGCHGEDGRGIAELGAPNLADAIWLYGSSEQAIYQQIVEPKHGMMPAWTGRLDDETIKMLTVYVHALGGGQ